MLILKFIKKNLIAAIAFVAAVITSVIILPDEKYFGYFDLKTLACLFCTLAVVCALKNVNFFYMLAKKTVSLFKSARACVIALVYVTFIGSMLIANDMALITFLPLGFTVLNLSGKKKYMAFTFIMQNISANLGGMLTPFGNPQNLYIYSHFSVDTFEFMGIMAMPFIISITLLTLLCVVFVRPEPLVTEDEEMKFSPWRTALYLALFALSVSAVFGVVPFWAGLAAVLVTLIIVDRKALLSVDYGLLMTFVFFFIFAGNMSRMPVVRDFFASILEKNTTLVTVMSCQVISNVPTAILLSQFTGDYRGLLLGVNIGGVGTLVASLASLITFREFASHYPEEKGRYIGLFSLFNFGFLIILTAAVLLIPF